MSLQSPRATASGSDSTRNQDLQLVSWFINWLAQELILLYCDLTKIKTMAAIAMIMTTWIASIPSSSSCSWRICFSICTSSSAPKLKLTDKSNVLLKRNDDSKSNIVSAAAAPIRSSRQP
jgi:hypothetical protein